MTTEDKRNQHEHGGALARLASTRPLSTTLLARHGISTTQTAMFHREEVDGTGGAPYALLTSPDGSVLFWGVGNTIRCWDTATMRCLRVLGGHTDSVNALALSGNGRTLCSGIWGHAIRCWDTATGRCLCMLEGHTHFVDALALSGDGRTLFAGSDDNTIRCWDTVSHELKATLHHLKQGFYWATPPDEASPSGWFWTDRPELVNVFRADDASASRVILADDDPDRQAYIRDHNRQDIVMARINDPDRYRELIDDIVVRKTIKTIEHRAVETARLTHHPIDEPE